MLKFEKKDGVSVEAHEWCWPEGDCRYIANYISTITWKRSDTRVCWNVKLDAVGTAL